MRIEQNPMAAHPDLKKAMRRKDAAKPDQAKSRKINGYRATSKIKENPYTFENNSLKNLDVERRVVLSPGKSIVAALSEDETDSANGLPPRFGLTIETSMNLENSGTWEELPDGSRLWRLQIKSPSAKSINLLYDAFHLPPGGRFHVYNSERTQVIGAFTELNNKGTIDRPGLFATGLVYGDEIILEYYHPKGADLNAIISINSVVHGYKLIKVLQPFDDAQLEKDDKIFGSAPACFVNVNCSPEGNNWQDEKKRYCDDCCWREQDMFRILDK